MAATVEAQAAGAAAAVHLFRGSEASEQTAQTDGMARREIVAAPGVWLGVTRTAPACVSGWHHHGDYETYIYVQSGVARLDFGPGGAESQTANAGDVLYVPRGAVHREANPGADENSALIVRLGNGEPVFNVDGPAG